MNNITSVFDISTHTLIELIHLLGVLMYLARKFYLLDVELLQLIKDVYQLKLIINQRDVTK